MIPKLLIPFTVLLAAVCAFHTGYSADLPKQQATREGGSLKQSLEAYQKGTLTAATLFGADATLTSQQVVDYYRSNKNSVTTTMKLGISRCLFHLERNAEAAELAAQYVSVYSNDWRGWNILGGAKIMLNSYGEALTALTNAAALGDEDNLASMAGVALKQNRPDLIGAFVPRMLTRVSSKDVSETEKLDLIMVLAGYAVIAERPEVFAKVLAGVTPQQITPAKI